MNSDIDVTADGGVVLGPSVICDGFLFNHPFRVQSHIHDDHMDEFETSKQFQDILTSAPTRDMLIAELNADLRYRTNFVGLECDRLYPLGEREKIMLRPSNHMLGSVQTMLLRESGPSIGYSGDFQWPMESPIEVEHLVVDSTYGAPNKIREYSQDEANHRLLELVARQVKKGPVALKGFRGTVQRALEVLAGELKVSVICSPRMHRDLAVFRNYGCLFDDVISLTDPRCNEIVKSQRYVRLYSKGDGTPNARVRKVVLGAYMSNPRDPVTEWPNGNFSVCLSDHADFWGTLEYVRATKAAFVVTDNTRGHGEELAAELRTRLGIEAVPSTNKHSSNWGE
jgi:putative mRNA 3-end processing factor